MATTISAIMSEGLKLTGGYRYTWDQVSTAAARAVGLRFAGRSLHRRLRHGCQLLSVLRRFAHFQLFSAGTPALRNS